MNLRNNSLSQEELIAQINNLKGGSFIDIIAALGLIGVIITLLMNGSLVFQPNPNMNIPPHLQWLYENQQPRNHFGYGKKAGLRSPTVTGFTQNAGSDKIVSLRLIYSLCFGKVKTASSNLRLSNFKIYIFFY